MAGKARFISGVFRAFAMARENRAERLAIFFLSSSLGVLNPHQVCTVSSL